MDRPILFSGPMVRAILSGAKTQTRRLLKPQPELAIMDREAADALRACADVGLVPKDETPRWRWRGTFSMPWPHVARHWSPYGKPGDRLWVRETWYFDGSPDDKDPDLLEYRADHDCRNWEAGCPCKDDDGRSCWRPSIHMPRWASRITLEVTEVRCERLQEVSEADARAEGITHTPFSAIGASSGFGPSMRTTAVQAFEELWDSINGKRCPWASNPWVWAVSFQRVYP